MKLNQDYLIKDFGEETILVHQNEDTLDYSKVISLNEIAILIIKDIQNGKEKDEILKHILDEYAIDEATAKKDLNDFIEKLKSLSIINE